MVSPRKTGIFRGGVGVETRVRQIAPNRFIIEYREHGFGVWKFAGYRETLNAAKEYARVYSTSNDVLAVYKDGEAK
jgi:hypothetical protein